MVGAGVGILRLPLMNSLSPSSLSEYLSEGRRPPLVSDTSSPFLGEHIGSPFLDDRSSGELFEVGDIEGLFACHPDPSSTSQYRLPSEMEYPENDRWAELSRAENGDTGGLAGGTIGVELILAHIRNRVWRLPI